MADFLTTAKVYLSEKQDDIDQELLSTEESSEDELEGDSHQQLLETITSLGKKRRIQQRNEPSNIISEFNLSHHREDNSNRVDTADLLVGLSNKKGLKQLKNRLTKVDGKTTHLIKPLAPVHKDKIHRKLAYKKSSNQISEWEPIVKHNIKAEHLQFPLQEDVPPLPSLTAKVDSFKPITSLEIAIDSVWNKSEHVIHNDQELSEAEKKILLKLSIQEAKERRGELRKMRALISAYEQKQRRINRIKSKKFHKIQRKRKEKMEAKTFDYEDDGNELVERAERLRAKERATLKHSRLSKWTKEQLTRKHRDPSIRLALTEQGRLRGEVKQKVIQESDSDGESIVSETDQEDNNDSTLIPCDSANPWLVGIRNISTKKSVPVLLTNSEMLKAQSKGSGNILNLTSVKRAKGDLGDLNKDDDNLEKEEDKMVSDNDEPYYERNIETLDKEVDVNDITLSSFECMSSKVSNRSKQTSDVVKTTTIRDRVIDPFDFLKTEGTIGEETGKFVIGRGQNILAVQEAFAGDDVIDDFLKEKQEEIEKGRPQKVDLTLPGWGEWGGKGVETKKRKKRKRITEETDDIIKEEVPRKDANLKFVIINHTKDTKASKHLVSHLPYSFEGRTHFARKMATPIGRHWNTETTYNEVIKPRISTNIGTVIEPMKMTDEVQKFIEKTKRTKRNKKRDKTNKKKLQKISQNIEQKDDIKEN